MHCVQGKDPCELQPPLEYGGQIPEYRRNDRAGVDCSSLHSQLRGKEFSEKPIVGGLRSMLCIRDFPV